MPPEPLSKDEPDPSIAELLRRDAYAEIGRMAFDAEDYALKLCDATDMRNLMAVAVRLQQLRFSTLAMIQTFNLVLRKIPDGQDMAEKGQPANGDRADLGSGDAVA